MCKNRDYHDIKKRENLVMNSSQILIRQIGYLLLVIFLIFSCAHKKAYKKALELEKSGQYVQAAEKDLEALDKKSDFQDAKEHLQLIAPKAYNELLGKAENYERNQNWMDAINSWNHLDILLTRFQRHGIRLTTVNVSDRLTRSKNSGLNYYYNNANQYFMVGDYLRAIDAFKNVYTIAGNYMDTKNRLWQAHIRVGDQSLGRQEYQEAINYYQASLQYTDDPMQTNQNIAEAYYQWGDNFSRNENYREATEKFELSLSVVPNYRDAERKRQSNYEKAIKRVAIMSFRNSTGYGPQYGNLLTEELINNCVKANLKYASFMTRSHLDQILEEHKLAMAGLVDATKASEIGKLEGIHYFVTGNVTQISEQTGPSSFLEKSYDKKYTEKDSAGNDVEKSKSIYYREYKKSRSVKIAASFQIVDVETGKYITGDNYTENVTDEAVWVRYQGSIYDLPEETRQLLDGRTEPKSSDIMINDGMRNIAGKMSERIITFLK